MSGARASASNDHPTNRRRADARPFLASGLLHQRRESPRGLQPGVVVQQDDVPVGGADAEVGVPREDERRDAVDPTHAGQHRLGVPTRAVVHHHDPLRRKLRLGPWFAGPLRLLASLKRLRGTALDPFGYARLRRTERALIGEYRALIEQALAALTPETHERAVRLARLPDVIRGYEEVKLRGVARFRQEARALGFTIAGA